jgi:hypothetical protein
VDDAALNRARLPVWSLVPLAAVAWWVVGYLPWLAGGMRAVSVGGRIPLPLSPALLSSLVLGTLVGGLVAGLLCLATARRRPGILATLGGVVLAVVVVLAVAVAVLRRDAPDAFTSDRLVVTGLCVVVVVGALGGWALGSAAAFGRPGTGSALAVLAGAVPAWLSSVLVLAVDTSTSYAGLTVIGRIATWAGAAVLVLALVTVGARPTARLAWWPLLVLAAWFVSPLLTAAGYLEPLLRPGMGLPGTLTDSLAAAWQVFWLAASPSQRDLVPWFAALVVAALVSLVRANLGASRGDDHRQVAGPVGVSDSHPPMINGPQAAIRDS